MRNSDQEGRAGACGAGAAPVLVPELPEIALPAPSALGTFTPVESIVVTSARRFHLFSRCVLMGAKPTSVTAAAPPQRADGRGRAGQAGIGAASGNRGV